MDVFFVIALLVGLILTVYFTVRRTDSASNGQHVTWEPPPRDVEDSARLYQLASEAAGLFQASAHPGDLLDHREFKRGVDLLAGNFSDDELLAYYHGDNAVIACMALAALTERPSTPDRKERVIEGILDGINDYAPWTRYFALNVLDTRVPVPEPLLGRILTRIDASWDFPICVRFLRDFVAARSERGEPARFGDTLASLAGPGETGESKDTWLIEFLPRLGPAVQPMVEELRKWRAGHLDLPALEAIGTVWGEPAAADSPVSHPALDRRVSGIEANLHRSPPRSVVLVGESGTGKTATIRELARRLRAQGWTIFEAGQAELMSGMSFLGELEKRVRELVDAIGGGKPVLWYVPEIHALSWAGKHRYGHSSVLDYLLPRIERGEIRMIGETTPAGYQRLVQAKPRYRTAVHAITVDPLPESETLPLVRDWVAQRTQHGSPPIASPDTLDEAWSLAQQFMGTRATPGNVLELLSITLRNMQGGDPGEAVEIRTDDLISTLGSVTGLPASILDDRATLHLANLRETFEAHVLGQDEAVECLVERVAMIKAGVTDPSRPQCVFLLAGPTGTGKTEIAKTLASFLFGSPERMIRLDMSELQDESWADRILGSPDSNRDGDSLIEQVRKQPFSVVLLDEFEKANRRVWDVFLQVFDDGRLTDRLGRTADFRHTLILMTSNLGAAIPSGLGLGFLDRSGAFSADAVLREVEKTFRKEFLNRIDRVIVFRALNRETMRSILRKELDDVYRRRGLRNRPWAVEWDQSALDFLLEKGFTADLGARPLKRAIERYLLSPLAKTIVDHRVPEGEQFLFVTSTGKELRVTFVDPDSSESTAPVEETVGTAAPAAHDDRPLPSIVLSPQGSRAEFETLRMTHEQLASRVEREEFHRAKSDALQAVSEPGFWDSPERFGVLGRAEYIDRIETSLESSASLLQRLDRMAQRSRILPRNVIGRLAQQLWLLDHALDDVGENRATEVWLLVDAGYETGAGALGGNRFARRLGDMYRAWARVRNMRCDVLAESTLAGEPYRLILAVSGYGSWALLTPEDGVHVWEVPGESKRDPVRRCAVRVRVAAQPDAPVQDAAGAASRVLDEPEGTVPEIVRRYRETPSPLVRDMRRGWRTGHLDRVLDGEFDVMH